MSFVWPLIILIFGVGFYRYFHRIPQRRTPSDPNLIVSPADGLVWQIIPLKPNDTKLEIDKRFLGKIQTMASDVDNAGTVVSIFMNPLDCHANWSPVDGKVLSVRYRKGSFNFANTWKSLSNEMNEILIQARGYKLKVIQIAGFVARRIDCWVRENDDLSRGQLVGMIRLGSQVSLILPESVSLHVEIGQKVRGGETVIATVKSAVRSG